MLMEQQTVYPVRHIKERVRHVQAYVLASGRQTALVITSKPAVPCRNCLIINTCQMTKKAHHMAHTPFCLRKSLNDKGRDCSAGLARQSDNYIGGEKQNPTPVGMIQEDQVDDGWSSVISDFDRVTNLKALRETFLIGLLTQRPCERPF